MDQPPHEIEYYAVVLDTETKRQGTVRDVIMRGREQVGWRVYVGETRAGSFEIRIPVDYDRYTVLEPGRPPKDMSWEAIAKRERAWAALRDVKNGDVVHAGGVPIGVFREMSDGDYMLALNGKLIRCDGAELWDLAGEGELYIERREI